jgi:hypothetical protein
LVAGRAAFLAAGAFFTVFGAAVGAAEVAAVVRAVVLKVHPSLSVRIKSDRSPPAGVWWAGRAAAGSARSAPFTHSA